MPVPLALDRVPFVLPMVPAGPFAPRWPDRVAQAIEAALERLDSFRRVAHPRLVRHAVFRQLWYVVAFARAYCGEAGRPGGPLFAHLAALYNGPRDELPPFLGLARRLAAYLRERPRADEVEAVFGAAAGLGGGPYVPLAHLDDWLALQSMGRSRGIISFLPHEPLRSMVRSLGFAAAASRLADMCWIAVAHLDRELGGVESAEEGSEEQPDTEAAAAAQEFRMRSEL